jgi:hypothetical protein
MKDKLINLVKTTASNLDINDRLTISIYSMGLVGEIGETIEAYNISQEEFKTELADIVWYTVALSIMLGKEELLDEINFNKKEESYYSSDEDVTKHMIGWESLYLSLMQSLKYLEKAKKYVRDYPSRDISSLDGFIEPLKLISNNFDLSDSFDILNKKLGARYPKGFVINGIR